MFCCTCKWSLLGLSHWWKREYHFSFYLIHILKDSFLKPRTSNKSKLQRRDNWNDVSRGKKHNTWQLFNSVMCGCCFRNCKNVRNHSSPCLNTTLLKMATYNLLRRRSRWTAMTLLKTFLANWETVLWENLSSLRTMLFLKRFWERRLCKKNSLPWYGHDYGWWITWNWKKKVVIIPMVFNSLSMNGFVYSIVK